MDAHRPLAARVEEDVDAVEGVRVHGRHDPARVVGADRDQAEVEGAAEGADLGEGGAVRQGEGRGVVVFRGGQGGDSAVAGVAVGGTGGSVRSVGLVGRVVEERKGKERS